MISISELAAITGVKRQTIHYWCCKGYLETDRCAYTGYGNRHWLILTSESNRRFILRMIGE